MAISSSFLKGDFSSRGGLKLLKEIFWEKILVYKTPDQVMFLKLFIGLFPDGGLAKECNFSLDKIGLLVFPQHSSNEIRLFNIFHNDVFFL